MRHFQILFTALTITCVTTSIVSAQHRSTSRSAYPWSSNRASASPKKWSYQVAPQPALAHATSPVTTTQSILQPAAGSNSQAFVSDSSSDRLTVNVGDTRPEVVVYGQGAQRVEGTERAGYLDHASEKKSFWKKLSFRELGSKLKLPSSKNNHRLTDDTPSFSDRTFSASSAVGKKWKVPGVASITSMFNKEDPITFAPIVLPSVGRTPESPQPPKTAYARSQTGTPAAIPQPSAREHSVANGSAQFQGFRQPAIR